MVKFIFHLSDIHIRTYAYHDMYRTQMQKFINELRRQTNGHSIEEIRIVLTGDLVHQKISISNEQISLLSWFLSELSQYGKVVIIPGNHDFLVNNQDRMDSISPIVDLMNNKNITYYRNSGVYEDQNIKWVVYSLYQDNIKPEFKNNDDSLYVGLFHGPIQGMTTDLGFMFEDAYDKLNFVGCDLVLCGDIHKRNIIELPDNTKVVMIGSFLQQNFGESINQHGYGLYDVENGEYTCHDIENEQAFLHFKITDIDDIENECEKLINDK